MKTDNTKSWAKWAVTIDAVKNMQTPSFESSFSDPSLKVRGNQNDPNFLQTDLLAVLFFHGHEGGVIKGYNDKNEMITEWIYTADGTFEQKHEEKPEEQTSPFKSGKFKWNGNQLIGPTDGYGVWDGIRLAWVTLDGKPKYPFNYIREDDSYRNTMMPTLTCQWFGTKLHCKDIDWIVEGNVPEPLAMFAQILHSLKNKQNLNPENSFLQHPYWVEKLPGSEL